MHVRITTATGVTNIDAGLDQIRGVRSTLQQQKGYQGISASADRSAGTVIVLTQWDSEADLDASESMADKVRDDVMKAMGGQMRVDRYEQLLREIDSPPGPGTKLLVQEIKMDPASIDENIRFFKDSVLPAMKASGGLLSVRALMNRETGEGRVGTMWKDDESLEAWVATREERRARAKERGVEFGEDRILEVLFAASD